MTPTLRRKVVAVVAGAVAALLPTAAINHGLTAYVERQSADEVRLAAQRAVARAEWRVAQAIATLADLGKDGLQSCASIDVDAVRRAILRTTPIKEVVVLDAAGGGLCPQLGAATAVRALSRELDTADDRAFLAAVRLRDGERALRVTWRRATDPLSLVAIVPADMFLPDVSTSFAGSEPTVRVMLAEGTLIAAPFGAVQGDQGDSLVARNESARYPLVATASVPRAAALAEQHELIAAGTLGGGALAVLALALAVVALRGKRAGASDELQRALEANEFVPYYQPLVDLRNGRVAGAEVLMRWRRRDGTLVPPAAFIPQAEASGLILPMTRALMEAARDEMGATLGPRPQVRIGFNLTAHHFVNEAVVTEVRDIFEGSPIRLSQILLEVTERQPLDDLDTARRVIAALQALGCQVAIDDVGTGHGGLSYILKLGVDLIKIDKMFVDALGTERYSKTIIETLIDLARNMGMEISAEGVETFEQVEVLRRCGVYLAQGYVFAPPLPGPQFRQLVEMAHPLGSDKTASPPGRAVGDFMASRDRVAAA